MQESPENPVAAWLWQNETMTVGETVQIRIGGSFILPGLSVLAGLTRIVFVAAGVGINPLISMLGYLAQQHLPSLHISFLYGLRVSPGDQIMFLDRITTPLKSGKLRGHLRLFITPPAGKNRIPANFDGTAVSLQHRRLTIPDVLQELPKGEPVESKVVYLCGPPTMTDDIFAELTAARHSDLLHPQNVRIEKWW